MNSQAVEAFKDYLFSPLLLAQIFSGLIFLSLIIAIMKVLRNGVGELREDENYQHTDLIMCVFRILAVLFILMIWFGF